MFSNFMSLKDKLKEVALSEISEIDLNMLFFYAKVNKDIFCFLSKQGIIRDEEIEGALEKGVLRKAKEDYKRVIRKNCRNYPENIYRPEFLAYGLVKTIFSSEEIERISFDKDVEQFCKEYGDKNLLSRLREELLNPGEMLKINLVECNDNDIEHPVCFGCD